jgi:hypothetical protein
MATKAISLRLLLFRRHIDKVVEKAIFDPVLTAQLSNGFAVQGPFRG